MNLLDIPIEVIFDLIFPHVEWNDLLRLRGVCSAIKPLAEDYLLLHSTSEQVIEIDLGDQKNLDAFLSLQFVAPVSRFRISNVKPETWKEDGIHTFVNAHGSRITHLQLDSLQIPLSREAINFFESTPNLESLEIDEVEERGHNLRGKKGNSTRASNPQKLVESIPATFRRLRKLAIAQYKCSPFVGSKRLISKFIGECFSNIEYLRHPGLDALDPFESLDQQQFRYVSNLLTEGPNPPNLQLYDLKNCLCNTSVARDFLELLRTCAERNVKLLNLGSNYMEEVMELRGGDQEEMRRLFSSVVVSLTSLHESAFLMELPHLKRIQLNYGYGENAMGTSEDCSMPSEPFQRQQWPNLEELDILIDGKFLEGNKAEAADISAITASQLLDFFFVGIERKKMRKVRIEFDPNKDRLPYPRMIDVSTSCPNLMALTLKEWRGKNDDLSRIWGDLQHLEKVAFKNCRDLGVAAFLGEDEEKPAILNAKKLRILKLDGLDEMLGINDSIFPLIRGKALKKLRLRSTKTLKNEQITLAGISKLLEGVFSETIERFDLSIELEGVTSEELAALRKKFRSSEMM